ncbi:Fc.00g003710.m01.CDS01 [Cosmosporella sp. VM-42]
MHSTSKSKSKSRRWSDWSQWIWNADYQRYYRQRQDASGNLDYEWAETSTSAATDEATPRETTIEDLTDGIAGLQVPSASATYDAQTAEYTFSSAGSRSKSKSKSSSRSKGKQRSYADEEDELPPEEAAGSSKRHSTTEEDTGAYYDSRSGQYYYPDQQKASGGASASSYSADPGYSSRSSRTTSHYPPEEVAQEEEDDDVQAAIAASRDYTSYHASGEPSTSAYGAYDYEDEGPPTPKATASYGTHISATEGEIEQLDPRYRVEHSSRFQPGEIFKVLWSEPQGSGNDGAPSVSDRREFRDRFGGKFFVGFRRFIVIANDMGHCTCVPILTYGGKGCKKRGVKPEKHGVIYEKGHKARLLSGEPKLGFAPAKVEITMEGEKLSKESRVNYSKLVTVEHNVKVFFIGNVTSSDWEIVSDAVNRCWEEKIHHKRKYFK